MYTLHEVFMPSEMQEQLLADFERLIAQPRFTPSCDEAKEWFRETVNSVGGVVPAAVSLEASRGNEFQNGNTRNTDIHTDFRSRTDVVDKKKYALVVANNRRSGTIFFDCNADSYQPELYDKRSSDLFVRKRGALAIRENLTIEYTWAQASCGQLCSFGMLRQLHAAAPQFNGDRKIILTTAVPTT